LKSIFLLYYVCCCLLFSSEKYSLIYVPEITKSKTSLLIQNGFNIDHSINFKENRIELITSIGKIHILDKLGLKYTIRHTDLESFYASRLSVDLTRDFENGSMGGYFTLNEAIEFIDDLILEYPDLISSKISIGQSLEGRDIWMIRMSDNPNLDEDEPEILYTGLHHSREPMSYMNLLYFMKWLCENYSNDQQIENLLANRELYFVPIVNPDGLVYNQFYAPNGGGLQRKNGLETCTNNNNDDLWDGVDLNRNYGLQWGHDNEGSSPDGCNQTYRGNSPFSEPETNAIKTLVENHDFKIALNYHSFSNILIYPFGWDYNLFPPEEDYEIFTEFGQEMTKFNGYEIGTGPELLYPVNGEACDWMYGEHGIIAYTPEVGSFVDGFWPETDRIVPLAEDNLHPNKFVAIAAGPMYEMNVNVDQGPYESGNEYSIHMSISNKGLSNSAGDLILNINSTPEIILETEYINLNQLASREEIILTDLFNFSINPNVISGTLGSISFILQDDEGIEYVEDIDILVGIPINIINQTFEDDDEMNWYVGDDDATSGNWEYGEPNGTELNGVVIQPYEDHSEFGTSCFVTGNSNAQASPFYDDIDGGSTSLYSPIYNLNDYETIFISYWKWYNNDMGDNPGNDKWIVEVTNNGGMSWTELENTSESNHNWINKQFILSQPEFDLTPLVQFRFIAQDLFYDGDIGTGGSLVEAALDDFEISGFLESSVLFGDVNGDYLINISDVILIINFILDFSQPSLDEEYIADFDQNGELNVLDIIAIVNVILGNDNL
jgi:hypothetical protein